MVHWKHDKQLAQSTNTLPVAQTEELLNSQNLPFLEALYESYLTNPTSIDPSWRSYFENTIDLDENVITEVKQIKAVKSALNLNDKVGSTSQYENGEAAPFLSQRHQDLPSSPVAWNELLSFLKNFQLFRTMSEEELAHIASIVRELHIHPKDAICREGEIGHAVYFIISGRVQVLRQGRFLIDLGPGEVVGEMSVLDSHPRSADVIALTQVHLLEICREDFQKIMVTHPGVVQNLLQVMVGRIRENSDRQERVAQLVRAYREKGHALAQLDPLGFIPVQIHPELTIKHYGLTEKDHDDSFAVRIGEEVTFQPLRQILQHLKEIYCGAVGVQYMHIDNLHIQEWLRKRIEDPMYYQPLDRDKQIRILSKLTDAEVFETFLHRKFSGAKRFSLEGSESLIPLLDEAIETAGEYGVNEIIIGMAHRGRLNVLANIVEKPTSQIFREFEDVDSKFYEMGSDVKYHLGHSFDRKTTSGQNVHLSLCFNPSHLEAVAPVVLGRTRAKQDRADDLERSKTLPIVIHGDAAFIGQGVVQELFNLSGLPGYTVGGTVHVVINNQIGFTTLPDSSRSSAYATDVARMLQIPIFHVNGESPEAVDRIIQTAMAFRHAFKKDIVIDMYCYRRHGHNEGDEPAFTQPLLYQAIAKHKSVRAGYVENLLKLKGISAKEAEDIAESSKQRLEENLSTARNEDYEYKPVPTGSGLWSAFCGGKDHEVNNIDTGIKKSKVHKLLLALAKLPPDFTPHRKIKQHLDNLIKMAEGEIPFNWGAGELLAYASLLTEGVPIRISGQDSQRGTFSHRHTAIHDVVKGEVHIPLQHIDTKQAPIQIHNSPLSEISVLGYEYGYSLDFPDALVIWEAQFGDFCNVAQVIFDQFISSSEAKWKRLTGLCVMLPHGFEGQGPEHSSARLERFLSLAAEDNMLIVNLTTPAQLFHCLRRQVHRPLRKPLIMMSPKSLLRHRMAVSSLEDFTTGGFHRLLPEENLDIHPSKIKQIILCSGKVYYDLVKARSEKEGLPLVILRLEQYYPFPLKQLQEVLAQYPKGTPLRWVQEEPENMGAWSYLFRVLAASFGCDSDYPLSCVSRPVAVSPATGSKACHDLQQSKLLEQALEVL